MLSLAEIARGLWAASLSPSDSILGTSNLSILAAGALIAVAHSIIHYTRSPWRSLPLGPSGYPILGSALKLLDIDWVMKDCKRLYGDIVYINIAGQPALLLNSQKVANDLLNRRAAVSSNRPRFIVSGELMCGGLMIPNQQADEQWRRMRRMANDGLKEAVSSKYHDMEREEAIYLTLALSKNPMESSRAYHRFASSIVLAITYDRPLRGAKSDETVLRKVEDFSRLLHEKVVPGAHLVESFPWMLHIPAWLARWKREALLCYEINTKFFYELMEDVEQRTASISCTYGPNGTARHCLTNTLLEEQARYGTSRPEVAWTAGGMYIAGSDTMTTQLEWFTVAMIAFPETQQRAQEEIDAFVGQARLPTFADLPHLPYMSAMVRELLRWRTGLHFAVPHAYERDDWYEGMFIPKGTLCFPNIYVCNLDPDLYGDDAHAFNPARFLDENGKLRPTLPDTFDEGHVSFGFGRRLCIGRHVAVDALSIAALTLLWAFKVENAKDSRGEKIHVDPYAFAEGLQTVPKPFQCSITPRFPEAGAILLAETELHAQ
ncbi:cytochrome P450 [Vararia minispora EC-137]|uniref:Cytochrome P450 n=1 Tax=Vararia minispora EC-137 TaxID=1314806 RepID=A0ACB8QSW8_9AGAM|nr:cytochrome P450 [Vararia minispora EC-137]